MKIKDADLGVVQVRTLELPDYVKSPSGTYTHTGTVLLDYKKDEDADKKDFFRIAVLNDDGSAFREIFAGEIKKHPKANGTRFMVFWDNKRVLLGDYVLECTPDIDNCEKSALVPVRYPASLYDDKRVLFHWSEIIVSPDNKHICWTALSMSSAAVFIGQLKRNDADYSIEDVKTISSSEFLLPDPNNKDCVIPVPLRGGEVKQFVRGGTAVSMVGGKNSVLSDSVVIDLCSDDITQITKLPGYEETTIFSPDEQLGIVMSTRGSTKTNFAILGHLPRPYGLLAAQGMILPVYMYAVAGVRQFRKGNVGPVLIDIDKSINDPGYMGVQLNDPEENWVYLSPMSWKNDGSKAMWPEMRRGNEKEKRLRIVELLDYKPKEKVAVSQVPANIPYAVEGVSDKWLKPRENADVKIAGKHSGYITFSRTSQESLTKYKDFSDDGKSFYNGCEKVTYSPTRETIYTSDLKLSGENQGEMDCRISFSPAGFGSAPVSLLFETAEDGKPRSYGYAVYNGVKLSVDDMEK